MVSQANACFMQASVPFKYGIVSYAGGCIGSYLANYKGKLYEALGFFSGGITAAGTAYLLDRYHGFNQRFMTDAVIWQVFLHAISTFVGTTIGVIGPLLGDTNITNNQVFTFPNTTAFYLISYISYIVYKSSHS